MQDLTFTIINDLAPIIFFAAIGFIMLVYKWIEQRMPEKQRAALDHFANIAAQNSEQFYRNMSPEMKKDAGMTLMENLFKGFGLPVPATKIMSAAIEAAVFNLPETYTEEEKEIHPLEKEQANA